MRLIDGDALKNLFAETMADVERKSCMALQEQHVHAACRMLCDMINDAKTIDAEAIRHGSWEWLFDGYYCSECDHRVRNMKRKPKYCEHCGAKMDAKEENNDED